MTNLYNEEIDYNNYTDVVNEKGLLASLVNHNYYIKQILDANLSIKR